ncbi:MAG: PIN domain-containing protein [Prevotellaceae bacterium]|jgi:predicted nucleic acid-binding protein|nr:PIN domain-containing protein [Prevotellaceae bacterium]
MKDRYEFSNIQYLTDRSIFVDANVLIYLFWSTGASWEGNYASAFAQLLKQKNKLFVDFLVISEVVNRAFKTVYETHKSKNISLKYKQFRDSTDGRQTLSDIYSVVKNQVLSQFHITGKSFPKTEIQHFLSVDNLDFLDKGILKICQDNNFVLLTNDKDFKDADVDVLTCNPTILRP